MIAGGTGINPFCDLIDLLFKEQLMIEKPYLREEILHLSPILENNPLKDYSF